MYNIKCFAAFERAFRRMLGMLFYPFDIARWFVLGFSAWLAIIFNSQSFGGEGFFYLKIFRSHNLPHILSRAGTFLKGVFLGDVFFVGKVCNYFNIEESGFWLIVFGTAASAVTLTVINLVLVWVSSRFKFIFIDNIANNRAEIAGPWTRFEKHGNSAFRWLIAFLVVCILLILVVFLISASLFYPAMQDYFRAGSFEMSGISIFICVLTVITAVPAMLVLSFAYYFFNEFVLPIMYRKDLSAKPAWREFLKLFKVAPLTFVKFWLLQIAANIACGLTVIILIICTFGVAVIPLLLPYLWMVVLLPIFVFQRLQAMELLAAFGSEYSPFPEDERK